MEIIESVHRIDEASANMAHSNVYLVINGKELTIIDTGTPGNAGKIVGYIRKMGFQPSDISTIVLTHYHIDHAGSARELKDLTNARVAVHEDDADYAAGKKALPEPKNVSGRGVSSFFKFSPVQVDIPLKDGSKIGKLTVVHTPGHTAGSISLLDEENRVLFVGDALRFDGSKVTGSPEQFTWDMAKVKESIGRISTLDFNVMLSGHGEPLASNAADAVKKFYETL
jgi:glyoxylase-like metal-dependent hydrolase (beta-lactamase superfamily II)